MQHKHDHTGDVNLDVTTDVGDEIQKLKEHFKKHKRRYLELAGGLGIAGISWTIMRGCHAGVLRVPDGSDGITVRPLSVLSNRMNVVTLIEANRQGAPSWIVRCKETGEFFSSQLQAAREMGISPANLSSHLNGKFDDVSGFHFERIAMVA
jgi:hypothetical protein